MDENECILKLVKLNNNNSFTLNIGNSNLLDFELTSAFNVTIRAWDYGTPQLPQSLYKFTLKLIDINDHAPKFEQAAYDIATHENNAPYDTLYTFSATDADPSLENSNITYSIQEVHMGELFTVDQAGHLASRVPLDRESVDEYEFHVVATDNGVPPLASVARVTLRVLDVNDNAPVITLNTSFFHRFYANKNETHSVLIRVGETLPVHALIADFRAHDNDLSADVRFELESSDEAAMDTFALSPNGRLTLSKSLERTGIHACQIHFNISFICQEFLTEQVKKLKFIFKLINTWEIMIVFRNTSILVYKCQQYSKAKLTQLFNLVKIPEDSAFSTTG